MKNTPNTLAGNGNNNHGINDGPVQKVEADLSEIVAQLQNGELEKAFTRLVQLKKLKTNIKNVDLLRGIYYSKKKKYEDARQAFLEELGFFPDNDIAKELLEQLPHAEQNKIAEEEFEFIIEKVRPYTMLSTERLYSLYKLAKEVCLTGVEGNFVECGVARGGSSALLAYIIKKYSKTNRKLYSFDTFEGMPEADENDSAYGQTADDLGWGEGTCAAPVESLMKAAEGLGAADVIVPVKGLFQDKLPEWKTEIGKIALLHMDGDWYESTKAILENLYNRVDAKGVIQVDDYGYWEGCRKAIEEFESREGIKFGINRIDGTGVWFTKPEKEAETLTPMFNLGCGDRYHSDWVNIDYISNTLEVIRYDLSLGIPFEDDTAGVIYHSHLLEHFSKSKGVEFIKECYRVLKRDGIIRIAVPDLEGIIKNYTELLQGALSGDPKAEKRYEWIMLELYDQTVRNYSGGEMLKYWKQNPMPAEDFVFERVGSELGNFLKIFRQNGNGNGSGNTPEPKDPMAIGKFRLSGEVHQWMYDRYSLGKLLKDTGFREVRVCRADETSIPDFEKYKLDTEENGKVRKPDSLFMEAKK